MNSCKDYTSNKHKKGFDTQIQRNSSRFARINLIGPQLVE